MAERDDGHLGDGEQVYLTSKKVCELTLCRHLHKRSENECQIVSGIETMPESASRKGR